MADLSERTTRTVQIPSGWARSSLVGVEAAILGWAVPAILAATGLLAIGADPWMQDYTIGDAANLGTLFWGLSLGGSTHILGLPVTVIPLGWLALQVLITRALLVSGRNYSAQAQWLAIPTFVLTAILILASSGAASMIPGALVGAVIIPFLAVVWSALVDGRSWPSWLTQYEWLWPGVKMGFVWVGMVVGVAAGTTLVALAVRWSVVRQISASLGATGWSMVVLILLQLAFSPNAVLWAVAWLSGTGFRLDGGTVFSALSAETSDGPASMVALPMFGLVPNSGLGWWGPILLVVVGLGAGFLARKKWVVLPLGQFGVRLAAASGTFLLTIFLLFVVSSGSLGVDRLARLGPLPLATLSTTALVVIPAVALALALYPQVVDAARQRLRPQRVISVSEGKSVSGGVSASESVGVSDSADLRGEEGE